MEDNLPLQNCNNDDALSFKNNMFKVRQIKQALQDSLKGAIANALYESLKSQQVEIDTGIIINHHYYKANERWFVEGIDCEILKIGASGWQKGKVKIKTTLEFIPDEPEVKEVLMQNEEETLMRNELEISQLDSPLDELRKMINQEN
ncbi:hypothetical protein NDI37_03955 [Funiculus sociatus GB2-A5]|uniref:KGK family protein n=1 Tax=Funiculus sociatus GB2-A5 TaxID=2933946 RepID=A0ABV0JJK9_9CYAN|nr:MULTISPECIES: KGK domain-containing protein [unclassified Trichocoleus]MBD1908400.1 KGK domain protein [Trichocoleus sp. FACHB-832]MBD2061696.1 KGK domain protein [Trichocoleus sp. FACHB-6]